jgi:hypothetical protein
MLHYTKIPGGEHNPAVVLAQRCREFAEAAELIKGRLRDMQCMNDDVNWAVVGSAAHCVEEIEQVAAFLGIPGYTHR